MERWKDLDIFTAKDKDVVFIIGKLKGDLLDHNLSFGYLYIDIIEHRWRNKIKHKICLTPLVMLPEKYNNDGNRKKIKKLLISEYLKTYIHTNICIDYSDGARNDLRVIVENKIVKFFNERKENNNDKKELLMENIKLCPNSCNWLNITQLQQDKERLKENKLVKHYCLLHDVELNHGVYMQYYPDIVAHPECAYNPN